jgi:hypothetical protein
MRRRRRRCRMRRRRSGDPRLSAVLVPEPLVQRVGVELQRPLQAALTLDLHDGVGVADHLDEPHAVA